MGAAPIRALTGGRRTKPTSTGCRRLRQPEPGRRSTYQAGEPVQTNRASSLQGRRYVLLVQLSRLATSPGAYPRAECARNLAFGRSTAMLNNYRELSLRKSLRQNLPWTCSEAWS